MKLLLDTNAYTGLMLGHESVVTAVSEAEQILMSAIVVGEFLFGFRNSNRLEKNRQQLESFLREPFVDFVPVGKSTCNRFGQVATQLRRKGKPIPQNDVWIAAHALETGADLITADIHFKAINGLSLIGIDD